MLTIGVTTHWPSVTDTVTPDGSEGGTVLPSVQV